MLGRWRSWTKNMPQELALYGEFSIQETLVYYGWVAGKQRKDVEEKIEFLLKFLLLPPPHRFVKTLRDHGSLWVERPPFNHSVKRDHGSLWVERPPFNHSVKRMRGKREDGSVWVERPPFNHSVKRMRGKREDGSVGGQQRRVSFAAALVHDPELLILDEPTVGVDPVLRQSIWDHLVNITQDGNKTVIITTHYIEETRQAGMIGLMRGGRFLAEESPEQLMAHHMCDTLEDVFLKLSKMQNQKKRRRSSFMQEVMGPLPPENLPEVDTMSEISGEYGDNTSISIKDMKFNVEMEVISNMPPEDDVPTNVVDPMQLTLSRMKALIWKNFLWMWRNVGVMLFIFLLPVLQIILFCLSIGRDPLGLHLAVFNQELNDSSDYFNDLESAKHAVESGLAWGTMHFSQNYSDSLVRRLENVRGADELTIDNSDIHIWMDMSNQQIGQLLNRDLVLSYVNFTRDILSACNYTPQVAEVPIRFNNPVYGDRIPNFTDFAAPGVILTIIFFLSVALTSGAMLIERNEGMLERSLVSGITGTEILFSHVVTQFVVMCGQTAMVLIFSFVVFNITCRGDVATVSALTVLTGLCGMCFGFVVSCLCDTERTATYLALGSFLPIVMLCGIIWPVEGMHYSLKLISFILPLTKSTESLRTILARGWSISQPTVYFGFVATLIWMAVFLTISILALKFRKG
uniref:ABC transporter n=1 Tax=Timema monikensis TaxID=170555 RepID=A0A7R9HJU2_9NEOP|nr:unnamed protein product [Timema monikensis]